jgi:hypothetical protein
MIVMIIDKLTRTSVKRRYFPNNGIAIDVAGIRSINNK